MNRAERIDARPRPETAPRRGRKARAGAPPEQRRLAGVEGGRYAPLAEADLARIDAAALEVLSTVGLTDAPPFAVDLVTNRGGRLTADGRLTFPPPLVGAAAAGLTRGFTLHGQVSGHELELSGARVHVGSGGAAPSVVDLETGRYRDAILRDLYDAARTVDALDHIHFFSRSLVARDVADPRALDLNTAYASLAGTAKHVMTSVSAPEHVAEIAEM